MGRNVAIAKLNPNDAVYLNVVLKSSSMGIQMPCSRRVATEIINDWGEKASGVAAGRYPREEYESQVFGWHGGSVEGQKQTVWATLFGNIVGMFTVDVSDSNEITDLMKRMYKKQLGDDEPWRNNDEPTDEDES